jgi:hypothetical protein
MNWSLKDSTSAKEWNLGKGLVRSQRKLFEQLRHLDEVRLRFTSRVDRHQDVINSLTRKLDVVDERILLLVDAINALLDDESF